MFSANVQKSLRVSLILIFGFTLVACNNVKIYKQKLATNATIQVTDSPNSILSSVRGTLDIYQISQQCKKQYKGQVSVGTSAVKLGLVQDWYTYLVFTFKKGGLFKSNLGSIGHSGFIVARRGRQYKIMMTYRDGAYDVVVRERRGKKLKSIELLNSINCVPKSKPREKLRKKKHKNNRRGDGRVALFYRGNVNSLKS